MQKTLRKLRPEDCQLKTSQSYRVTGRDPLSTCGKQQLGVVAHVYHPSTGEPEAGGQFTVV